MLTIIILVNNSMIINITRSCFVQVAVALQAAPGGSCWLHRQRFRFEARFSASGPGVGGLAPPLPSDQYHGSSVVLRAIHGHDSVARLDLPRPRTPGVGAGPTRTRGSHPPRAACADGSVWRGAVGLKGRPPVGGRTARDAPLSGRCRAGLRSLASCRAALVHRPPAPVHILQLQLVPRLPGLGGGGCGVRCGDTRCRRIRSGGHDRAGLRSVSRPSARRRAASGSLAPRKPADIVKFRGPSGAWASAATVAVGATPA